MIISIAFSNFYSFADETEISFELGKKPGPSAYDIPIQQGRRLNKVVSVVGANGSGKTQLIKPLAFLSWFISQSFLSSEPKASIAFKPHALLSEQTSNFKVNFIIEGQEYQYSLEVNPEAVVRETLKIKTSHLFSYIFDRKLVEAKNGNHSYQFKQKDFGFTASKAREIRGNASLISAAYNYDVPEAAMFVNYFANISYNLNLAGRLHYDDIQIFEGAEFFHKYPDLQTQMSNLLCCFDLGLNAVNISEGEFTDANGDFVNKAFVPFGIHQHQDKSFRLPFYAESSGTRSAFVLLRRILPVLKVGGLAVIDEIDNDLHPHMLPQILDLFKFKETNPFDAQLIFTCHTPEIMNLLRKHQIYLIEKNDQKSEAWRLDDVIGLRADDNLYAKYMAGALRAVPDFTG